jgi:hypothetical protein
MEREDEIKRNRAADRNDYLIFGLTKAASPATNQTTLFVLVMAARSEPL